MATKPKNVQKKKQQKKVTVKDLKAKAAAKVKGGAFQIAKNVKV